MTNCLENAESQLLVPARLALGMHMLKVRIAIVFQEALGNRRMLALQG